MESRIITPAGGSPLTTKGDIFVFGTAGSRLPAGANGQTIVYDSTQPLGLKASTPAGGGNVTGAATTVSGNIAVWSAVDGTALDDGGVAPSALAPKDSPAFTTQATFSYSTASKVPYLDASKKLIASAVTPTELGYVSGVTSAIQTQFGAKAPLDSPAFTTKSTFSYATATTVPYLNASKELVSSAVTPTELGYVSGVTSALQTQLNALKIGTSDGFIESGSDKSYTLVEYAKFAGTINDFTIKTASGTVTVAIKINGTNVTGLSAVSATSTQSTTNGTAANTFAAGDRITMVFSSSSTPTDVAFSLKYTRS